MNNQKRAKPKIVDTTKYYPSDDAKIYDSIVIAGDGKVTYTVATSPINPRIKNVVQIDEDDVMYMIDVKTVYCTNVEGFLVTKDNYGAWEIHPVIPLNEEEEAVFNRVISLTMLGVCKCGVEIDMKPQEFEVKDNRFIWLVNAGIKAGKILEEIQLKAETGG